MLLRILNSHKIEARLGINIHCALAKFLKVCSFCVDIRVFQMALTLSLQDAFPEK